MGWCVPPVSNRPYHFIGGLIRGPTFTKQTIEVCSKSGPLALEQTENLSTRVGGGFFSPFEVLNFAIELSHIVLHRSEV